MGDRPLKEEQVRPHRARSRHAAAIVALALATILGSSPAWAAPGDPNVTVTSPTSQQQIVGAGPLVITGAATDATRVARVSVAIRRNSTGQYLRSTGTWGSGLTWLTATLGGPSAPSVTWSYTWATPLGGAFTVTAQAWDNRNRTDPTRPSVTFTITTSDTTAPTRTISVPSTNQTFTTGPVTFSGTSTDAVGVTAVDVSVRDRVAGLFLAADGTWGATETWLAATLGSPGGTSTTWTYPWASAPAGDLALSVRARDAAGNTSSALTRNFQVRAPGSCPPVTTYGVGVTTLNLVDASRGRSLPTTINYPSNPGTSGTNAPPACGSFPLVIVGHGGSGTGASAAQIHRFLVQNGYIIAGPTLPAGFDYVQLTADVRYVITQVLANAASGSGPLAGHLDAEHIGFIGTSKGGFIGLALYQAGMIDPRIDAILPKIATAPDGTYDWAAGPPLLMINGTADTSAPYEDAVQNYADASPPKGLVTLEGVDHTLTVGSGVLIEGPLGFFGYFLKGQANGLDRIAAGVATEPVASLQADWGI